MSNTQGRRRPPVPPHKVEIPRDRGKWTVIYTNDEWAIAVAEDGAVGVRWNAYVGANSAFGYPNSRRAACWFVMPPALAEALVSSQGGLREYIRV
ncbi:MAG: hypothetical protein OYL41_09845 [Acidobacteriota bacterium]|nr:hypothetical protein [Acidobacteriota bacterium]